MHHSGFRSMCCGYVVQVIRYLFLCICRYLWLREPDEVSDSYNSYCYINCQLVGPYLLACNIFSLKAIHMVAIQHDIVPLFCLVWEQGEM
jgi:hypothetical protein